MYSTDSKHSKYKEAENRDCQIKVFLKFIYVLENNFKKKQKKRCEFKNRSR